MSIEQIKITDRKEVPQGSIRISYKELKNIFEAKPRDAAVAIARKYLTLTDDFILNASNYDTPEKAAQDVFAPPFSIKDGQSGPKTPEFESGEFKQRLNYITAASRLMTAKSNIPNLNRQLAGEFDEKINGLLGIAEKPEELMDRREFNKLATVSSLGFATALLVACSGPTVAAAKIAASETPAVTATIAPTQKSTEKPIPTEKPVEKNFIMNSTFPSSEQVWDQNNREFPGYSTVTLEDITSGRLTTAAKKWYAENPSFMSEAITPKELVNRPCHAAWSPDTTGKIITASITEQILYPEPKNKATYVKHQERIPIKVISFFPVQNDKTLLETVSSEWQERKWLWIALWAYKNPSGNVSFSQSLFRSDFYDQSIANRSDNKLKLVEFMPVPVYAYTERNQGSGEKYASYTPFILDTVWKNHPELSPEPFAKKFGETGEMPEEMATKLFGVSESCEAAW